MKIYIVGGAVRDSFMGIVASDVDYVVTGSTPEEMISLGYEQVGAAFPVFLRDGSEYALARKECKVGEGYLGFSCQFGPEITLEEDLFRRDLSINSIAYDPENDVYIDPCGGIDDIVNKVLCHTSDAFSEDPLRVIRLARFSTKFPDFSIDHETLDRAIDVVNSGEMDTISDERYWAELLKVFSMKNISISKFFNCLSDFGVLEKVKFFKEILNGDWQHGNLFDVFISSLEDPVLAMCSYIALKWNSGATFNVSAMPNRLRQLVDNVQFCVKNEQNPNYAEFLYSIVAKTGSKNVFTPQFIDLMLVMPMIEGVVVTFQIIDAQKLCAVVSAEPFMHLNGKEIGEAMKNARINAIKNMLQS
jgi:tRNA nucleotidyltransferase/poly(A) polymerase